MPAIGFGTWQILFHSRKRVAQALEIGYRLIDTAKIYGNEVGVGAAIRSSNIPRKYIFLTTKLWNSDQGYENGLKAIDESLNRLRLDYIDLYLIHWPGHDAERRRASWKALEEIYTRGKTKAIGVSNYKVEHLDELKRYANVSPAVNQIEFHPFIYNEHKPVVDWCKRHNVVVEAYSPLAHGRHADNRIILDIAQKEGITSAQVMLAWCIHHGTVPIPKSTDAQRMLQNFEALDIKLKDYDIQALNNLSRGEHVIRGH